ncbi:50S ribosomal protein L4 [Staphylococcus pseudintermedius]|uniref:50S ribosomal protein L4 n=1 Tax=Staphylococcus pseudintermedius TaxID=283734 RepID=UPI0018E1D390|nr:50S ribosomal protein L4 [Staphylococcus pseudintermedius]EGQ0308959.1 50S ribosomal protein L4 [Staphylococcus pseudintermedius]EGQ1617360.1 50S ribosomal protein L4 [Staphylococcus pseudintermedius]EGQ1732544.1 50S ribosomal protein L4 [Staphylococcus pseudintermedius]EGQ2717774.1 50S ribosomal protein L4 [Staphylococcus pseudintermedius]EGQ2722557.1 50S ribosomal protein L4 [Staphylococcus pseudintermedius]
MANYDVYKVDGSKAGTVELSDSVFGIEPNNDVLFEAINLQRASLRQGTHAVKNRSAVRGGGRKPWRQKGTGRARQGTIRAPQWRGGGIVFGPTPRSYGYKMPKKMRRLALRSALSYKVQENGFKIVDSFNLETPKTKEFKTTLTNLELPKKVLVVTVGEDVNVELSARNIPGVTITTPEGLNVLELTHADSVLITQEAAKKVEEVLG